MNETISLPSNLLLVTGLFWDVPTLKTNGIARKRSCFAGYCHTKLPPMREDTLSWARPLLK